MKPVQEVEPPETSLNGVGANPSPAPRPRLSSLKIRRSLRILLAEDNPVNQELAVRLLGKWGHAVTVAGNGQEALSLLELERFDLVLMDVQMPEMDGIEATLTLRAREKGCGVRIPVIAMTAYALSRDRDRCLEAGMDDYVTKPIEPRELFATIERLTA